MDPNKVIIEEMRFRPILNNLELRNKTSRHLVEDEWKQVSAKVGLTNEKVKQLWKSFRDHFRRGIKKILDGVEMDGGIEKFQKKREKNPYYLPHYYPKWKYFDQMSEYMIDKMVSIQQKTIILVIIEAHKQLENDNNQTTFKINKFKRKCHRNDVNGIEDNLKCSSQDNTMIVCEENGNLKLFENDYNIKEDIKFFESLLPYMKEFSDEQRALVKVQIEQIIFDNLKR